MQAGYGEARLSGVRVCGGVEMQGFRMGGEGPTGGRTGWRRVITKLPSLIFGVFFSKYFSEM